MNKSGKIAGLFVAAGVVFLLADNSFASSRFHFSIGRGWGGHGYGQSYGRGYSQGYGRGYSQGYGYGNGNGGYAYHRPSQSFGRGGVSLSFGFSRPSYGYNSYPSYPTYSTYYPSYSTYYPSYSSYSPSYSDCDSYYPSYPSYSSYSSYPSYPSYGNTYFSRPRAIYVSRPTYFRPPLYGGRGGYYHSPVGIHTYPSYGHRR